MDLQVKYLNGSNCLSRNESDCRLNASSRVPTALASVLIFTIVVDILGNVLVILSVFRNKKLRNAGERQNREMTSRMLSVGDGRGFNGQNMINSLCLLLHMGSESCFHQN